MAKISPNIPSDIAKLMQSYKLSNEEHNKALEKIRGYVFNNKSPSTNPQAWLVIAQTGAGKSNLSAAILRNNKNAVVIDPDAFKAFNPKKEEIVKKYPTLYGYLTGLDAYDHRDEIYAEALKEKYDILIEIAPSTKDELFNVNLDELIENGYKINVSILAVSDINSLLSIHERYEGQIEAKMCAPKLTDIKRHNDSYSSMYMILEKIIKYKEINELSIYKRNLQNDQNNFPLPPVKICNDKNQALQQYKDAIEEDKEITLSNSGARINQISNSMHLRGAPKEQWDQLTSIIKYIQEKSIKSPKPTKPNYK